MSDAPLAGRTALVTGASRGIGLAISHGLADAGARVAMLARTASQLDALATSIDRGAFGVRCDLLDGGQVAAAVERVRHAFAGPPDILVLNAGIFPLGSVGELPPAAFADAVGLSSVAPYALLHELVPGMRARGSGHIVSIGSVADRVAYPENSAYAAAKFAARGLHEVLRAELAGSGVRASLVSPGPVDTPLWDAVAPDTRPGLTPRAGMLQPDAVADAVLWVVTRASDVNVDELRLTRA